MAKEKRDSIQAAVEEKVRDAKAVMDERAKIRSAIARAKVQLEAGKADEEIVLKNLAGEEADAALASADAVLGKQPVRTEGRARKHLDELRAGQGRLEVLTTGLQRRLVETDQRLLAAEAGLEEARAAWKKKLVGQFSAEFETGAATFQKTLLKGAALADALGATAMGETLERIELRSFNGKQRLLDLHPVKLNQGGTCPAWRNDSAAVAIYNAHAEPLALATDIAKELAALHARLNVERAAEEDRARKAEEQAERTARREREEAERLAALEKEKAAKAAAEAMPWHGVGVRIRYRGQRVT